MEDQYPFPPEGPDAPTPVKEDAMRADAPAEAPFAQMVRRELRHARAIHQGPQTCLHQGYAVLLEEVDELWDEVKKKRRGRDPAAILRELVQVAAMAQRTAEDLGLIDAEPLGGPDAARVRDELAERLGNLVALAEMDAEAMDTASDLYVELHLAREALKAARALAG